MNFSRSIGWPLAAGALIAAHRLRQHAHPRAAAEANRAVDGTGARARRRSQLRPAFRRRHVLRRRQARRGVLVRRARSAARREGDHARWRAAIRCSMKSTSSPRFPAARSRPPITRCSARKPSTATRRVSSITTPRQDLWNKVLKPSSWPRLAKPLVSRSDLEVEYFDQELFNGATVYDVMTRSPRVIVERDRPGARQAFRVHARAAERHLRGPENRAGGARGVRFGGDAYLFRAAGDAHFRRAMRLPAAGQRDRRCRSTPGTPTDRSAPSGCSRSSTPKKLPYLHLADGAFADNLGARAILDEVALGDTRDRRAAPQRLRARAPHAVHRGRCAHRLRRDLCAAAQSARHQEGHGCRGQRHGQSLQLRNHEPDALSA